MNREDRITLRRKILAKRDRLTGEARLEKSRLVAAKIMGLREVKGAAVFCVYMHFRSEVRTLELIRQLLAAGKTVTVPSTRPAATKLLAVRITDPVHQVGPGYCGIPEPLPQQVKSSLWAPEDIDLVIVPGSVFDRLGGRLGYGGGFYDRFLAQEAARALRLAPAYELQLVDRVPVEVHDQPMDFVVTENTVYDCRRNRNAPDSSIPR